MDLPHFEGIKAVVIGDIMLDAYWYGQATRISPEAPVPVVCIDQQSKQAGGAGNVALNMRQLGCAVRLFSLIGTDDEGRYLERVLTSKGVQCHFGHRHDGRTIQKIRIVDKHQQLIRLDFESHVRHNNVQEVLPWLADYEDALQEADVVVLSDYAKGTLQQAHRLIAMAARYRVPVFVDPKARDFDVYRGATLIKPNLSELEQAVGHHTFDQMLMEAHALLQRCACQAMLITRGREGVSLLRPEAPPCHFVAHQKEVYDVTGAGDTVIAVLAASVAAGLSWVEAAELSNLAAGLVVMQSGAVAIDPLALEVALKGAHAKKTQPKANDHTQTKIITDRTALQAYLARARDRGAKIVMTNGCFDVLHAGHVQYLNQAADLGDVLLVAVNDDASVQRLKGAKRPLNGLNDRMAVLAALACVDGVIAFSEDTPGTLIQAVRPDQLVKGGDYIVDTVVGSAFVQSYGGEVVLLPFKKDCSTSRLLRAATL